MTTAQFPIPERLRPMLAPESDLQALAERFDAVGRELYLVGGSVRDAVLNRPSTDVDLTTDARPDEILELVRPWADTIWTQGQRFGTIGARRGDLHVEITTFRDEVYHADSRKPEVTFSDDIYTDLSRRDFTVNAMALRLGQLELIDPHGGIDDLVAGKLTTPLSADVSFTDDPLRMLRAARFIAQLGLTPDDELIRSVEEQRHRMSIVSAERIQIELAKLLVAPGVEQALWFLCDTGLSDEFLPELNAMRLEQDPIHRHKDVLAHTIAVVGKTPPRLRVRLAALFHDIAKPQTRSITDEGVSFHFHDVVGGRMTRERMKELRFPTELTKEVVRLVRLHLRFHTYKMGWSDRAVRRYVRDAGPLLEDLNDLVRSDCTTRNKAKAQKLARRMDELEERITELEKAEALAAIKPPLDGLEVMTFLDLPPGPLVGKALGFLLDLRLDVGPMTTAEAFDRLREWALQQDVAAAGGTVPDDEGLRNAKAAVRERQKASAVTPSEPDQPEQTQLGRGEADEIRPDIALESQASADAELPE
ncbi:MAG: CCA tRNA nucleotidyltransferase [Acidimicrobiia bacterium]|nr:CCA tRNA nucleotidyltransferase [Acidimicrobiia bacterium]